MLSYGMLSVSINFPCRFARHYLRFLLYSSSCIQATLLISTCLYALYTDSYPDCAYSICHYVYTPL